MFMLICWYLECCAYYWYEQVWFHGTFYLQEADLLADASGIACQRTVSAYHAVAGDDKYQRIMSDCSAHGLCRAATDSAGQLDVGDSLPVGDYK